MTECLLPCPPDAEATGGALAKLMTALAEFHNLDPEMPVSRLLLFLHAASQPGLLQSDLQEFAGLAQSGCSRAIAAMSRFEGFNRPGLDLIEAVPDPKNRRRKVVTLTDKGEGLAARLRQIVGG